jgi:hypothetical protein
MLSTLPPELLRLVIESTILHSYHPDTYKERQATLYSLSLVSRRFRQIAEPFLAEIVKLDSEEELRKIPDWVDSKGWNSKVREVAITVCGRNSRLTMSNLETFVASCPNIAALSLEPNFPMRTVFSAHVLAGLPSQCSSALSTRS